MDVILFLVGAGALCLAGLLAVSAIKPDDFSVERSILIGASPEDVFRPLQDLRIWSFMEAYRRLDEGLVLTHGATTTGVGASCDWDGEDMGAGRLTIVEAQAAGRVVMKLDLVRSGPTVNVVTFLIEPSDAGSRVNCTIAGPANLFTKVTDTLSSRDKWMGDDIDASLAGLKATAEQAARLPAIPVPLIAGNR